MTDFSFWQFVFCFCPPETDTKSRTTYVRIEVEVRSSARQRRRSNLHVQWAGSLRCRNKRPCSGSDGYRWPTCSRLWGCGPACRTEHLGREERIRSRMTSRSGWRNYILCCSIFWTYIYTRVDIRRRNRMIGTFWLLVQRPCAQGRNGIQLDCQHWNCQPLECHWPAVRDDRMISVLWASDKHDVINSSPNVGATRKMRTYDAGRWRKVSGCNWYRTRAILWCRRNERNFLRHRANSRRRRWRLYRKAISNWSDRSYRAWDPANIDRLDRYGCHKKRQIVLHNSIEKEKKHKPMPAPQFPTDESL